ncbi:unnamed protein product [Effrenium voratum]|uniref:CENP-V/GFA domain-containing protein n=1 Tax=Effrenium voratum TaxID=2562239 RepID=A0AA36N3P7_9DINO|nr:unnamed protein product [Effrenium voratum]
MADVLQLPSSCLCKKVRFLAPVDRERSWLACHCPDCRRAHGAAWVPLVPLVKGLELHGARGSLKEGPFSTCSGLEGSLNAEVRRHFCQSCGSTCLVSLHMEGQVRCSLLPAGVLSDKDFPKDFCPKLQDLGTQSPAPFGPLAGPVFSKNPGLPILGSCLCGRCRFRTVRSPRELQHCHCSMCRQISGAAYQTWTPVPKMEMEWITPNALKTVRASRHATREFCQDCGSAMTIMYSSQRSTVWVSAAAYDKTAFFGLQRQQALHICADSAPPWHLPDRWALDGIKRIGDVCEDTDEAEPEAGPYLEAGAESEEEDFQLQQVLQRSRLEVTGCDQELTGCSLLQAEQALATTGSIDAAAEALLGCADSDLPATRDSDSPKKRPELELEDDRLAKKPKSEAGTNCQAGAASGPGFQVVWRGELAKKLKSSSAVIDLCD